MLRAALQVEKFYFSHVQQLSTETFAYLR